MGWKGRRKGGHGGEHGSIAMDLKDSSRKAASGRKVLCQRRFGLYASTRSVVVVDFVFGGAGHIGDRGALMHVDPVSGVARVVAGEHGIAAVEVVCLAHLVGSEAEAHRLNLCLTVADATGFWVSSNAGRAGPVETLDWRCKVVAHAVTSGVVSVAIVKDVVAAKETTGDAAHDSAPTVSLHCEVGADARIAAWWHDVQSQPTFRICDCQATVPRCHADGQIHLAGDSVYRVAKVSQVFRAANVVGFAVGDDESNRVRVRTRSQWVCGKPKEFGS